MRSLLAIFIAVLLLGVAVAEDVTQLLEKFKDIDHARSELFKRLHPNGRSSLIVDVNIYFTQMTRLITMHL
jgi:hypothetical protein